MFFSLLGELAWLETRQTPCRGSPIPYEKRTDPQTVCALHTIPEFLAWANGSACPLENPEGYTRELSEKLRERIWNRTEALTRWEKRSREERLQFFSEFHPELSPGALDRDFAEFLFALRAYVRASGRFSPEDALLFYSYFHTGYLVINPVLRAGGEASRCMDPLARELKNRLKKLEAFEGIVWRGLNLPRETVDLYRPGEIVWWPAFSSTSLSRDVAEPFANKGQGVAVLMKIHSKECIDVRGVSDKLGEQEILCLPGTRMRVLRHEKPNVIVLEEI